MGDMLTQDEINALLSGGDDAPDENVDLLAEIDDLIEESGDIEDVLADESDGATEADSTASPVISDADYEDALTTEQKDVLGEIGNISMGTAATTLFTLLSHKVLITTPRVTIRSWYTLSKSYDRPCVGIKVNYTEGLTGTNILILKEQDVKVIANLMMGGDGTDVDANADLSDLELSAVGEAMNQMVGSSSTSLSSVIKRKIDIDTPQAMILNFGNEDFFDETGFIESDVLACIAFRMEIGDLIDSEITQIIPINFAKDIVAKMMSDLMGEQGTEAEMDATSADVVAPQTDTATIEATSPQMAADPASATPQMTPGTAAASPTMAGQPQMAPQPGVPGMPAAGAPVAGMPQAGYYVPDPRQPVMYPQPPNISAQPASFEALDFTELAQQKENIGIIMDVPLEVTVELGRTTRRIREILEFSPGTIVDLDKLAGEPIDILVNGKFVASGEVVVVDENFAVRVTDIVNVDKRI